MGIAFFGRAHGTRRHRRQRPVSCLTRPVGQLVGPETLELRALLTTFYVDNSLLVTADRDSSGGLSAGDQVTFGHGQTYQQTDLTYDAAPVDGDTGTAFSSIGQALASSLVQAGDTVEIAGGTYNEAVTIDKSLTLQGEGAVVIAAPTTGSGTGITINDDPDTVTLQNLSVQNFQTSLSDSGGGTLNLVDFSSIDGESSISKVDYLNVVSNSTAQHQVTVAVDQPIYVIADVSVIHPMPILGPPSNVPGGTNNNLDYLSINSLLNLTFSGVKVLSFATAPGSKDNIWVNPLPDTTVNIDGDDSTSAGIPGDTLNLTTNYSENTGLIASQSAAGISGSWTSNGGQPINFSNIASLLPGIAPMSTPAIVGTQGVDTGSQVVAQFIDPIANGQTVSDTATISWDDGSTSSAGTITYDAATGVYSVLGNHTYAEGGAYTVSVSLGTPNGNLALPGATANIAGNGTPYLTEVAGWTLMPTVGQSVHNMDIASFNDSLHLPVSDYTAEINWGDGTSSPGLLTMGGDPEFTVFGEHVYNQSGDDQIVVTILRNGTVAGTLTATAIVSDEPIDYTEETLSGTAGVPVGGTSGVVVAKFEEDLVESSTFQATIDWGDGTTTTGTVSEQDNLSSLMVNRPNWQVTGSHTYVQPGTYDVTVELAEYFSPQYPNDVVSQRVTTITIAASGTDTPTSTPTQTPTNTPTSTPTPTPTTTGSPGSTGSTGTGGNTGGSAPTTGSTPTLDEQFVMRVYQDLLSRPAETTGLAYWSAQLSAGMSRSQMVSVIEESEEYRRDDVESLFSQFLQRAADPATLAADANALARGESDEQLAAQIIGSDEYYALHGGSTDGFLNGLFQDVLHRPIDASAEAALEPALAAGVSRQQIAAIVFGSHEYATDLVNSVYVDLLDRNADDAASAYWSAQVQNGLTDEQLIAAIAASDEFYRD
ncbi:MAG TPA: DUF4214 domain-containing protein [Pirellulales bacterium]|nr:DUF4214 domain-containing protein [Pirellulales bacterium]